ncbi:hypothetical protein [Sphingomicrobium flavum]|uniref:hypothetical protein n=1 Tax=Sphingomicrobium flavum TaxID=1229164 RepID=UPI0021AE13D6|nr:hypothetical protein [Sphingomicrobium flavum]
MKWAKRVAISASLLTIGWLGGPIVAALALAAKADHQFEDFPLDAHRLVESYRETIDDHKLFLTIAMPEGGSECGYEAEDLFPSYFGKQGTPQQKALLEGYETMEFRRRDYVDEGYFWAVAENLSEDFSPYELRFLRRCIEDTILTNVCAAKVEPYGQTVDRYEHPLAQEIRADEEAILCTYVDGAAARLGFELADTEKRNVF